MREDKTGGILAGPEDKLKSCVDAIDQHDQGWPNDPYRMVAQISKLAQTMECTVVFRQNMHPDGVKEHSSVWQHLQASGSPQIDLEDEHRSIVRIPLFGRSSEIVAAMETARQRGWVVDEDAGEAFKVEGGVTLTLQRYVSTKNRTDLLIEYPVEAGVDSKQNAAGFSQSMKLPFVKLDDLFDTVLGPTVKRYKFVLLIRDRTNSILFFGTKTASTVRQAIEQYCDHMSDRKSFDEPRASRPESDDHDILDEMVAPSIQDCRFWKF